MGGRGNLRVHVVESSRANSVGDSRAFGDQNESSRQDSNSLGSNI